MLESRAWGASLSETGVCIKRDVVTDAASAVKGFEEKNEADAGAVPNFLFPLLKIVWTLMMKMWKTLSERRDDWRERRTAV